MVEATAAEFKYADLFDEVTARLAADAWKKPVGAIPATVYHYTNPDGLFGLLSSKRVWATDYRFLNDLMESEIGWSRAKDLVRKILPRTEDRVQRQFYEQVLEILKIPRVESNFVYSLSSRRDDLAQWRMYADDGRGFTIGFDTSKIVEIADNSPDFSFGKVSYSSLEFDKKVRSALQKYWRIVSKQKLSGPEFAELIEEAAIYLDAAIGALAVTYKHSSFRSEFEWRINTFVSQGDPQNQVVVRSNGRRLIPYVPLRLCGEGEDCLPITKIGIGPGFRDSGVRYAVEKLCQQAGIEARIYNADTPFRRV